MGLIPIFTHIFLQAQFMYCIIFYSFKHGPSLCNILEKLRESGLEGMSRFLLDIWHEPNPSMLPSGQEKLITPQAY